MGQVLEQQCTSRTVETTNPRIGTDQAEARVVTVTDWRGGTIAEETVRGAYEKS